MTEFIPAEAVVIPGGGWDIHWKREGRVSLGSKVEEHQAIPSKRVDIPRVDSSIGREAG